MPPVVVPAGRSPPPLGVTLWVRGAKEAAIDATATPGGNPDDGTGRRPEPPGTRLPDSVTPQPPPQPPPPGAESEDSAPPDLPEWDPGPPPPGGNRTLRYVLIIALAVVAGCCCLGFGCSLGQDIADLVQ